MKHDEQVRLTEFPLLSSFSRVSQTGAGVRHPRLLSERGGLEHVLQDGQVDLRLNL
jgi:hypothetical protein